MNVEEFKASVKRYIDHGVPPGDFVQAVLKNDLIESFGKADEDSRSNLFDICTFVYNHVPMMARGRNVHDVIQYGGLGPYLEYIREHANI